MTSPILKEKAKEVARRLAREYPDAECALVHKNPFELLVATILSAQCTDERVNQVTPAVFAHFPTPQAMSSADPEELEDLIRPTGFFRNKTKSLLGMSKVISEEYGGEVPKKMDQLTRIPGVGRKTANVIRSVAFDLPGLPVDTHVMRLSKRLGLTKNTNPVKIEYELNEMVAPKQRGRFSLRLILHGRAVCVARTPRCEQCVLADICPSSTVPVRKKR